ncbi:hypothetical protein G7Z17_g1762 [Cylindrodendrum hubeiense]|uniref:Alpha/beta hydrolase fold-3 domain-containing protein n=1 Tax=Cylindrodendrum hubeiense TaxID=595255 RepID=A0A9P5LF57_9HYPO|nr:hypothetical protein G7Z17_g1762 [Cylindrodendrum hubeiense]
MDLQEAGQQPWIWHPDWTEPNSGSAGRFVHFRKRFELAQIPPAPVRINITADTRYKLYINGHLVHYGPVKGDECRWFYDTVDINSFLQVGTNQVAVHVLRFYEATLHAPSFARLPYGGLYIREIDHNDQIPIGSDETWETSIDHSTKLRIDEPYDAFLHIFEERNQATAVGMTWTQAKKHDIIEGWGITAPWKLHPRLIPFHRLEFRTLDYLHNVRSDIGQDTWARILLGQSQTLQGLRLAPGTSHHVEIGVQNHLTALLVFRFATPAAAGSTLRVTYSECYEDEPRVIPFNRRKGDRQDSTKKIFGPSDYYKFGGVTSPLLEYRARRSDEEAFQPFHFRTFRYMALDIEVHADAALVFKGIDITETTYPLQVKGSFDTNETWTKDLWDVSIRTLQNSNGDPASQAPVEADNQQQGTSSIDAAPSFTVASISFTFYTLRAFAAVGDNVYNEHFHDLWSIWKDQIAANLSTWAEDSVSVRSDCHAWGSTPIYEFTTEVAGIKPATPGWESVDFKPRTQLFPTLKAKVPLRGQQSGIADFGGTGVLLLAAKEIGASVVSVDYRLVPEHKAPAAVVDSHSGLIWIFNNAKALGMTLIGYWYGVLALVVV